MKKTLITIALLACGMAFATQNEHEHHGHKHGHKHEHGPRVKPEPATPPTKPATPPAATAEKAWQDGVRGFDGCTGVIPPLWCPRGAK